MISKEIIKDEGWNQIDILSGELKDKKAWILNLDAEGNTKPFVYEFELSEAGQHKVLINLPGNRALGTCGIWTKEKCGYEQVQVSLEKQDGTLIKSNYFDTYDDEFVDEKLFAGHLDVGVYRLKISAGSKAGSFEAYHHLSFESLEVIKEETLPK